MRLHNFTALLWASFIVLCLGIGCSNKSSYEPLENPKQQPDPDDPDDPDVSFVVYNYLADFPEVNPSAVWEVTLSQGNTSKKCLVFQSTCPQYDPAKGMINTDKTALGLVAGRSISWANFSFDGEVKVTAKIIDPSKVQMSSSVAVYPRRKNITPSLDGQSVSFTLTKPGQYSVEVGEEGYKNGLMIFANPKETDSPKTDAAEYLHLKNATPSTIANISSDYTGIYFDKGVHDIGKYDIPSHIKNIYIPGDAYVFGTLLINNNPGVRIFGRGTLSAARLPYRESHSIEASGSSDGAIVEGITIADFTHFSVRLVTAYNKVEWVKTIGAWTYNCDGISVFNFSTVKNCFIWANDDNIKVYRDGITFEDIVCWQLTNGNIIQMAWNDADAKDVIVKRVDILHADWNNNEFNRGILGFVGNRYAYENNNNYLENYQIEDLVTETPVPVILRVSPQAGYISTINGLTLKNWNVRQPNNGYKNYMYCSTPELPFRNITFDNFVFNGTKLTAQNWIQLMNMQTQHIEAPTFK